MTVTYTDATPTGAEFYRVLPELVSGVQTGVFMGVSHFIMHPRRFWWLAASIGTSFPLLHAQGVGHGAGRQHRRHRVHGDDPQRDRASPSSSTATCSTTLGAGTEDVVLAVTATELHFWDDGVQFIRAEQTAAGNLTVKFVLYGYSAFSAGRYPGAHGVASPVRV